MIETLPIVETTPAAEPAHRGPSSALLFWLVAGIPFAMLLLAFVLIRTSFFRRYADPAFVSAQRQLFEAKDRNCSVLIYGDSAAMAGLDPAIIQKETGLPTCNIAATAGVLEVQGLQPLNDYLNRNPRPRYLILHFVAPNFHESPVTDHSIPRTFDGYIYVIRYSKWTRILQQMVFYPDSFTGLLHYVYDRGPTEFAMRLKQHTSANTTSAPGSYLVRPEPPLKSCLPNLEAFPAPDPSWLAYLRAQYSQRADHLFIDVAPVSACDTDYPRWQNELRGLLDNRLYLLPIGDFIDAFHPTRAGALRISRATAAQILAAEQKPAPETK